MSLFRHFQEDPFFSRSMPGMPNTMSMFGDFNMTPLMEALTYGSHEPSAERQGRGEVDRHGRHGEVAKYGEPYQNDYNSTQRDLMMYDPFRSTSKMMKDMQDMFGNMQNTFGNMARNMDQGMVGENGAMYSSSSYMSYSNVDGAEPKVYQATVAERRGPGGLRETRKTERNSETCMDKMAVGRHIHDKGHVMTKQRDRRTGHMDEHQDFENMHEDEVGCFNDEWNEKAGKVFGHGYRGGELGYQGSGYQGSGYQGSGYRRNNSHSTGQRAIESSPCYDYDPTEQPTHHDEDLDDLKDRKRQEHRRRNKDRRRQ